MARIGPVAFVLTAIGLAAPAPTWAQDAAAGAQVFRSQCAACHVVEPGVDKVGPSLFGVTGAGGPFTDPGELDRYLMRPKSVVPKTMMTYPGLPDPQQRKDLLAYLSQFK